MVVVGADVHKRTHTFVAVDAVGKKLGSLMVEATSEGHFKALKWAADRFGSDLTWAIEDCRQLSARLERDLLGAGQAVVRVPPSLTSRLRASARERGKSDPIDALAVARAFLQNPDLPVASHDEVSGEAKLLVDRREALVRQRTRAINSLRSRVHTLQAGRDPKSLILAKHQRVLQDWLAGMPGLVAEFAREELAEVIELTLRIKQLEQRIVKLAEQVAPALLAMPGCGALTAVKLVGEAAGIGRFATASKFARHAGVAPIPVWSGNTAGRVRLTRSGNRQLNAALHRIAITQIRLDGAGRTYYDRKKTEGKSKREAIRSLKRALVRTVFHHLTTDQQNRQNTETPAAA